MATIQVKGKVQPFRKGDAEAVVFNSSSSGEYANFVLLEQRYNKLPMRYMCTVENSLVVKLKAFNLRVGDSLYITGNLERYTVNKNGVTSFGTKIVVLDFEFIQEAMRGSEKKEEIDLSKCNLFVDSIA